MKKQKNYVLGTIHGILYVLMIAAFIFFFAAQTLLPPENLDQIGEYGKYDGEWEQVFSDGTRKSITVPGSCEAKKGEWVTVETVLPENLRHISFSLRSMQQDFKIYIDDRLVKEYSTVDTQLFGKTSTIAYVFFEAEASDAGKTLRMEFMTDSSYAGYLEEIYMGDRISIWQNLLKTYVMGTIFAIFLLIFGIAVVVFSVLYRFFYKTEMEMLHLGNTIIVASTWLLAESRIRQFFVPNGTVAVYLGFFMIMLLPYPLSAYINKVQKGRYEKVHLILSVAVVINTIFSTTLQLLEIKDFFETMLLSHILIGALIIILIVTIALDIRRGYVKEYLSVVIGFAVLIVGGIGEIVMVYSVDVKYNGVPLCVGMIALLLAAGMKTRRDILQVEKERKLAVAASESKAQFLANISHEIRTPINTIVGMNEMILREVENENARDYAHNIKSASEMLLGLINDILNLSKLEVGKLCLVEDEYSLASMLQTVIVGFRVRIQQKELEMKLNIADDLPSVLKGDEIRIKQILNNLLSNAVKYTDEGSVTLEVSGVEREEGFFLRMSVIDTGIGIEEENIEHLFDTFKRFDLQTNRNIEGTGLGLSITKYLVDLMHGTISVASKRGEGSCFTVEIPQEVLDATFIKLDENPKKGGSTSVELKVFCAPDAKILIVDDNEMNLKVIGALLRRTQVQMDFATGGNECLEMTREKKYDLILMDHMMPKPDGVETLHLLREEKGNDNQDTPVVVLTANAVGDVENQYREAGFAAYLSKPVEVERLEQVLAEYIK